MKGSDDTIVAAAVPQDDDRFFTCFTPFSPLHKFPARPATIPDEMTGRLRPISGGIDVKVRRALSVVPLSRWR
jgi:hypothetical protein